MTQINSTSESPQHIVAGRFVAAAATAKERLRVLSTGLQRCKRMLEESPTSASLDGRIVNVNEDVAMKKAREPPERDMLKLSGVIKLTGLHRNTIGNLVKAKKFPQPTRPNGTMRLWYKIEIVEWRKANVINARLRGPRIRPLLMKGS